MGTFTDQFTRLRGEVDRLRDEQGRLRQARLQFLNDIRAEVKRLRRQCAFSLMGEFRRERAAMARELQSAAGDLKRGLLEFAGDLRLGGQMFHGNGGRFGGGSAPRLGGSAKRKLKRRRAKSAR
ncbi:MAG: hypothetical protein HYS13_16475 [Planctomycetia bacterium]|nr:hypothetical protein [Planctomycetia bacterium]